MTVELLGRRPTAAEQEEVLRAVAAATGTIWQSWVYSCVPHLPLTQHQARGVVNRLLGAGFKLPRPGHELNLGKHNSHTLWLANCTADLYWVEGLYPWGPEPYVLKLV